MKINTNSNTKQHQNPHHPKDLSSQTYAAATGAHQNTKAILEYLESPPEGGEDPILQLTELLMQMRQQLNRIEQRQIDGSS